MGILGDLADSRANGDAENPPSGQRERVVGEIPLNNAEHMGAAAQSGNNGGTGRSHGRKLTTEHQEGAEEEGPHPQKSRASWFSVIVLALALIGLTGYGYLVLQRNNIALSQLPGIQRVVTALAGRMDATEAKMRDLTANWNGLDARVAKLDRKVSSSLLAARRQTEGLITQAEGRLRAEIDTRTQVIDARVTRVESGQAEDRARVAQMQDQLQKEVGNLREQVADHRDETGRDLASLHQQANQSQRDLNTLAQQMNRQRVNFEAAKNSPVELVPGVSLTVVKTNVSYQRFNGYLTLTEDARTLWLPNVGVQQSVAFYSKQASHPYDLVVTGVNKNGVVGYLMLPAGGSQG